MPIFISLISIISGFSFAQAQDNPNFFLHENGVTIMCPDAEVGETGTVDEVEYEAVDRELLIQRRNEGADLTRVCTSLVTDMSEMFQLSPFNQPIGDWDVSNVTNMGWMFDGSLFNQSIGNWDVSNVTNMGGMFRDSQFNQPIGNWNVGNVTNMGEIFANSPFDQPIGNWDVSNVEMMRFMFDRTPFNQSIGDWDVSNVTNMSAMFRLSQFNQPIGEWNVGNVKDMFVMFLESQFNQPLGNWDVSSVTNMQGMFRNSQFNQSIGNWDVNNVTRMDEMFEDSPFNQSLGTWDVTKVAGMDRMFSNAISFNQDLSSWCSIIPSEPTDFATGSELNPEFYPKWGSCSIGLYRIEQSRPSNSVTGTISNGWLFNETQIFEAHMYGTTETNRLSFRAITLEINEFNPEISIVLTITDETVTLDNSISTGHFCGSDEELVYGPATQITGSFDPDDDTQFTFAIRENINEACGETFDEILFTATKINTSIDDETGDELPKQVSLRQNYPNPFNPVTQIRYELPVIAEVRLEVFNLMGQRVATLVSGEQQAGVHIASFNAGNYASGVYMYRLSTGNFVETRKMVLVK